MQKMLIDDRSSSGTSTTISSADMQAIVDRLKGQGNRSSTRANYYQIWKKFNQFIIKLDKRPDTWEERLVLFVGFLIQNNRKAGTIKSYISAIRAVLREDGEILNENKYLLASLTKACRFINDQVRLQLPIKKKLLEQILFSVEKIFSSDPQPYLVSLYQTLFATAYYGLFRVGELTDTPSGHAVKARDVHIGQNKKKLMFVLHTSKTDWFNTKPQTIKISSMDTNQLQTIHSSNNEFCPFQLLRRYIALRGERRNDNEQFFIFRDGTPVSAQNFRKTLRQTLTALNLDEMLYCGQSLRAGRTCDLAEMGLEIPILKSLGRWSSSAVYTYLKY